MNKQRFLAGDLFGFNGKRYYYHEQSKTVLEFIGGGGYQAYAKLEMIHDDYAKLAGKFFDLPVTYALYFQDMKVIRP